MCYERHRGALTGSYLVYKVRALWLSAVCTFVFLSCIKYNIPVSHVFYTKARDVVVFDFKRRYCIRHLVIDIF